jgi:serine/threonine protein kinase
MIAFNCPACNHRLTVNDEHAGKRGTCPHCKKGLLVPAATPAPVPARPPAPAPAAANPLPLGEGLTAALSDDTPSAADSGDPNLDFLAPPQKADEMGRLGPYRVLKILGAGGMGIVLQAEDPALKRPVAVKVMRPELAKDEIARQRFLREAQATAAIEHHNIVHIHQVAEKNGVPFIVMPLLKGEPLDSRLNREQRLSLADAMSIGKQVAEGLAEAHKAGLIHRDIKPANIWLTGEAGAAASAMVVKIVDFGLARGSAGDDVQLTKTGAILGTPPLTP